MTCAACSARVEKAVNAVEGITSCSVNLLTGDMVTEGASAEKVIEAVVAAGYGATLKGGKQKYSGGDKTDAETKGIRTRLIASLCFLLFLMYVSMGHMMLSFPVPRFLEDSHTAMGLLQLILSGVVMVINQKFFISGFKGLINRSPNMDTLVALGSGASFVYSTYVLFKMAVAESTGNTELTHSLSHEFYFESAAMILTLITVGKLLESLAKGKTTDALKSLMSLAPKTAILIRGGEEMEVPVEEVVKGDVFVVRPGGKIPVDAVIIEGECAVDESSLTGESIPVDKKAGEAVSASTVNLSGYIKCRATRVGEDTTIAQIIEMVSSANSTKAPIAKVADKVSGVFVPVVIGISLLCIAVWLILGEGIGFALERGISVLVISCPCALGLATPVAVMVGSGVGAKGGILFKTAASLEAAGRTQIVVLDKPGTITYGKPEICDVIPSRGVSENELLRFAYALEAKSEHPLALAIVKGAEAWKIPLLPSENFKIHSGNGLSATVEGSFVVGGKADFIKEFAPLEEDVITLAENLAKDGKTPLYFAKGGKLLGIIAVSDKIKEDSTLAVAELRKMGLRVVMLTGDNTITARAVAASAGIDEVVAGVMPEGKADTVNKLRLEGKVAMVGDGVNDAPALVSADTGIAIGAGVDVAIDSADVVLMKSRLSDVCSAIKLSRATLKKIHENLFWAFIYNVIGIPLAAGAFINLFGWELSPMFGAAAMSLSSFCVVTNALRLNFFKMKNLKQVEGSPAPGNENNNELTNTKEKTNMKKTVMIEGMMCPHCEAHVKRGLEALEGVVAVTASHTAKSAEIESTVEISDELIRKVVEGLGYKMI